MLILIVSILLLGVIVAIASKVASRGKNVEDAPIKVEQTCATCNGTPETKCEQDCMMEASTKPIEYFDDEELDVFSGRTSDSYTDTRPTSSPTCSILCARTKWQHGVASAPARHRTARPDKGRSVYASRTGLTSCKHYNIQHSTLNIQHSKNRVPAFPIHHISVCCRHHHDGNRMFYAEKHGNDTSVACLQSTL